ncbi:hypothetical protein BKA83DRAFT_2492058 [Pisolithus microcarpus]|nr:hypothetical protein BKA83DRAFT_2492058 [Pisolithus microcarpus]
MARKQSKKHHLFGSRNTSGPPSSPVSSGALSQAPIRDVSSIAGASGDVSQGTLARMRHVFHRSNKGSVTGAQQRREQTQDTQGLADNLETGAVLVVPSSNVNTTAEPLGDNSKGAVDPDSGLNVTLGPTPALVGGEVDAARQALDLLTPLPRIGQTTIGLVTQADTAVASIQNFSDTYLRPLKVFNSIVTTIAQVHPYAQIALGILAAAAQSLINQANLDHDVSDLLDTIRTAYEFLLEDDTLRNINSMRATLGKIAQVISDAARFIKNYSETTSFY